MLTQPHLGDSVFPFPLKKICIEIDSGPGSPRGDTKIWKPLDFGFPVLVRKMLPLKTFEKKTGLDEHLAMRCGENKPLVDEDASTSPTRLNFSG